MKLLNAVTIIQSRSGSKAIAVAVLAIAPAACLLAGDASGTFHKLAVGYNTYASLDKTWIPNQSAVFARVTC